MNAEEYCFSFTLKHLKEKKDGLLYYSLSIVDGEGRGEVLLEPSTRYFFTAGFHYNVLL